MATMAVVVCAVWHKYTYDPCPVITFIVAIKHHSDLLFLFLCLSLPPFGPLPKSNACTTNNNGQQINNRRTINFRFIYLHISMTNAEGLLDPSAVTRL